MRRAIFDVRRDKAPAEDPDNPVVRAPLKFKAGDAVELFGKVRDPVIASPAFKTFNDDAPANEAVIVPAEKFPEPSLATIVFIVFVAIAVVALLLTLPVVEIVANFVSDIAAAESISAFVIKDVDNTPELLL